MEREPKNRTLFGEHNAQEECEKRYSILLAAAALFAHQGYNGTPVREIVEAAKVTKPTLYYYFKNKEELYTTLMELTLETFFKVLDASLRQPGTMRKRLKGLFLNIYELFRSHVDLLRLVNQMVFGPEGATPSFDYKPANDRLEWAIDELISRGIAEGELLEENRAEVMLLLLGLLRSMQVLLLMEPERPTLTSRDIGRCIDLIFDGAKTDLEAGGERA